MLHEHNIAFGDALAACNIDNAVVPLALPQSVNQTAALDEDVKKNQLPIITTIDFLPAIKKAGPDWHAYDRANDDLKFVTSLYDVVFGVLSIDQDIASPSDLKGKRIGAPARPSAVRVFTEALLRDGWGIIDEVEIVDISNPAELADAIANNEIDATTWNLMSVSPDGLNPLIPDLLEREEARWIGVELASVSAINAANVFKTESSYIETAEGEQVGLLSFRQALAAWETTPGETVTAILECMEKGAASNILPNVASEMAKWPDLVRAHVHPAAAEFYGQRGVVVE